MTKICEHCGKEFAAKRNDAKFCSSSCRSLFCQNNYSQIDAGENFQKQLKGVMDDNSAPVKKTITETIPNLEYIAIQTKLLAKKDELKRLQEKHLTFTKQLQTLKYSGTEAITILTTGTSAFLGYNATKNKKNEPDKRTNSAFGWGLLGFIGGAAIEYMTKDDREKQQKLDIMKVNVCLNDINAKITLVNKEVFKLTVLISFTKREITIEREVVEKPMLISNIQPEKSTGLAENKHQLNVCKQITLDEKTFVMDNPRGKIISSNQLAEMNYQALNFQGRWQRFLGFPSINFHLAMHGMSGEGKSTMAIQFAYYLAEYFGPTIYISGEEGFSKTMKDKFINNNATNENLFIADLRSFEDIINEVKPNIYNFIFIDSLDNMRIGPNEMKELRKIFHNSALISISQSTKDGKMRGSYEIVHDSDMAVSVSNGIATTTKNRFLEKGRTYEIFKPDSGEGLLPCNTIKG